MSSPITRLGAALVLVGTLAFATACSAPAPAPTTSDSAAPAPSSPEPEPTVSETQAPQADPTCETIIPESTVADFESVGWTVQVEPFLIGAEEVPDGIICKWADFEGLAGDHLQRYGWAEISDADAQAAQDNLVSEGWIREDSPEGVYITESPSTAIAVDEAGYGTTYLFADGAVSLADTKQGLILVEWPRG